MAIALALRIAGGAVVDRIVATVDGRAITESELARAIVTGGIPRAAGEAEGSYRSRVLSEMIDEFVRYRDALRFSPAPPDAAEIRKAFEGLRARLVSEGKDPAAAFRDAGLSEETVRAAIARQLVVSRYVKDRFSALAIVAEDELRQEYEGAFSSELKAAGRAVPSYSEAEETLRARLRDRKTSEEVEKWTHELREKARITILENDPPLGIRTRQVLSSVPPEKSN